MVRFRRENEQQLQIGDDYLYPDCAFRLHVPGRSTFCFYVELDNGSQPVQSSKDLESWERKIHLYDALQDAAAERFRVLIVSTRSDQRIQHIMARTAALTRVPERSLFYGMTPSQYLATPNPVTAPCFRNHRGQPVPLVYMRGDDPAVLLRATGWCALRPSVLTSRSCRQPGSRERRGINECPDSLPTHPEHSAVTGTVGSG